MSVVIPPDGLDGDVELPICLIDQVREVCSVTLGWMPTSIKVISGGITNALFKVSSATNAAVVVRVFGQNTSLVVDRVREEIVVTALSKVGFGKQILSKFCGGQIEEWLEGRSLKPDEMTNKVLQPKIALRLGQLHGLPASNFAIPYKPSLWSTLRRFHHIACEVEFEEPAKQTVLCGLDLAAFTDELIGLESALAKLESPVVMAHNDLLSGNIVVCDSTVDFIDFEYGSFNYRAFDLANHFCECCGFACDWDQFPNKESQFNFFRNYLRGFQVSKSIKRNFILIIFRGVSNNLMWRICTAR